MKKLHLFTLSFSAIVLLACSNSNNGSNKDLKTGDYSKDDTQICNCKDLKDSLKTFYLDTIAYTGICQTYYPNSENVLERRSFLKGKLHGNYDVLDQNSQEIISSTTYINGAMEGDNLDKNLECNCKQLTEKRDSETKVSTFYLKSSLYTGLCKLYSYDSTTVVMEKNFVDGKIDGELLIFDNEGKLLQLDKYSEGKWLSTKSYID